MPVPSRRPCWSWIAALLLAALPSWAVKGLRPDGGLDKPTLSKAYFEGETWIVINALEAYRKSGYRGPREDSLYVLKYLGAAYAADPATRPKGEACLRELFRLEPKLDLADLYLAGDIQKLVAEAKAATGQGGPVAAVDTGPAPGTAGGEPVPAPETNATPEPAGPGTSPDSSDGRVRPDPVGLALAPRDSLPTQTPEGASADAERIGSRRGWLWPIALGGVGVAAMAVLLVSLDAGSGADDGTPRPVDVTLEWPKEGSP